MPKKMPAFRVFQHGRKWWVRFSLGGSQQRKPICSIKGNSETEARTKAREVVEADFICFTRSRRRGVRVHPFTAYQSRIKNKSTNHRENCARFQQRLIEYFGTSQNLHALTREDVEDWREHLLHHAKRKDRRPGNLSRKTVAEHINWLAAVLKNADLPNPCARVERPSKTDAEKQEDVKFFTPEEMDELFVACKVLFPEFYNAFHFMANTGCRVAEMRGLRGKDINYQTQRIFIVGKGQKRRPLTLAGPMEEAWETLMNQLTKYERSDGFVFRQGETWAAKKMIKLCEHVFEGKKHGHPHMLRHTFASMALQSFDPVWDLGFLAKWLGHSDISTTYKLYWHFLPNKPPSGFEPKKPSTKLTQGIGG